MTKLPHRPVMISQIHCAQNSKSEVLTICRHYIDTVGLTNWFYFAIARF